MNSFTLRIIAIISMLIDHIGAIMPEFFGFSPVGINPFRVIGRLAFPIFVYLIAEGFRRTKDPAKFLARLGVFALISEVPFDLALHTHIDFLSRTNIFYTLFLGGASILAHDKIREILHRELGGEIIAWLPMVFFAAAAQLLTTDYGAGGVLFIFAMYIIKPVKWRLAAMAVLSLYQFESMIRHAMDGHFVPAIAFMMIPATLLTVPLMAFYNGKRGPGFMWAFYVFYPAHLLILAGLKAWL